jgi:hypothetical protein
MSFGEHFKFSISCVHCKVFWRVSNYLFNIGSFLILRVSLESSRILGGNPEKPGIGRALHEFSRSCLALPEIAELSPPCELSPGHLSSLRMSGASSRI